MFNTIEDEEVFSETLYGQGPLEGVTSLAQLYNFYSKDTLFEFFSDIGLDKDIMKDFLNYDPTISDLNELLKDENPKYIKNFLIDQGFLSEA